MKPSLALGFPVSGVISAVRQRTKHFVGGHPPPNISTQLIDNKGLIMATAVH